MNKLWNGAISENFMFVWGVLKFFTGPKYSGKFQ